MRKNDRLQDRLQQSFSRYKDHIAVEYGSKVLTYAQLDRSTDFIAHWLLGRGVGRETFIGVLLEDRVNLLLSLIGILKANGVFMPLDPGLPPGRLGVMIEAADTQFILVDRTYAHLASAGFALRNKEMQFLFADEMLALCCREQQEGSPGQAPGSGNPAEIPCGPEDKVYIYFTSGSTDTPNALVGKNKSVLHFVDWEIAALGLDRTVRCSQLLTPGFDAFLRDVFVPLCCGGSICIPGDEEILLEPGRLAAWLETSGIGLIHCVPGLFRLLSAAALTPRHFSSLKYILLSGERIHPTDLVKWYETFDERIQLVNLWGTSETTLAKTAYFLRKSDIHRERIPIGKPIPGARVIIMDRGMNVCKQQMVGMLYIRTPYRTYGYYNNPGLNRERFIQNPFNPDPTDLLHRTGDLGRRLADGNLDLLGRDDRQVKIRGIRIELEEIEALLVRHARVGEAVVIKKETQTNESLYAYIVAAGPGKEPGTSPGETLARELENYLSGRLPAAMMPAAIYTLERIPRTSRGKVDYDSLADPLAWQNPGLVAPRDALEKRLAKTWSEVLGTAAENIGITSHFFKLGGNSLTTMSLITKIHKEFAVRISLGELFNHPTLEQQAEIIRGAAREKFAPLELAEEKEYYALSSAQKRMYILYRLEPGGIVYNMPNAVELKGPVREKWLEETFARLIKRHESFRTTFEMVGGMPVQRMHREVRFGIDYFAVDPEGAGQFVEDLVKPFELSRAPLLRVGLIKLGPARHILLVDMHHIISDGTSSALFSEEALRLYHGETLPPFRFGYKDYALWQRGEKAKGPLKKQEAYWLQEFAAGIPALDLPTDFQRPAAQDFAGRGIDFRIEKEITDGLKVLAARHEVTLFILLLALFNVFLSKLGGQEDLVVGTPVEGRRHEDLRRIIGIFINMLPLRNWPVGDKTFLEFLGEVRERTLTALENQEYPFDDLVEVLVKNRDVSRNPLFDVVFVLQNPEPQPHQPAFEYYSFERGVSKFDLALEVYETKENLFFEIEYRTKLFNTETIQRFINYFKNTAASVIRQPASKISGIEILSHREKKRILVDFNRTRTRYPRNCRIHELFEEQAAKTPGNIALIHGEAVLTYSRLNREANRLANLLKAKGAAADTIVAIMIERSIAMIVGILGILKAGAAYIPIDPVYPEARIKYILADSGVIFSVNLTRGKEKQVRFKRLDVIDGRKEKPPSAHPRLASWVNAPAASLAYIIYTSGSTGRPRGAAVEHRSLVNLCHWHNRYYAVTPGDRAVQYASLGFDASVWEIFPYLAAGAALHIIEDRIKRDISQVDSYFHRQGITIAFLPTPAAVQLMLLPDPKSKPHLRALLTGGDKLRTFVRQPYRVYNNYGPTENTVVTTSWLVKNQEENIPIGKPIDNNRVYILKPGSFCLQPIGVPGELCIAGLSLARGYLNNPEMTNDKFGRDLWDYQGAYPGSNRSYMSYNPEKFYKTGDLARWLPDGKIEFLSRLDQQVKIRGFRVELAEIEKRILAHREIGETAVVARENNGNGQALYAYIVPKSLSSASAVEFDASGLKSYLSQQLPAYMVPDFFVLLEKMPLSKSGKFNRNALVNRGTMLPAQAEYVAPRSHLEAVIAEAWRQLLKREQVGIHHNFFDAGGNSMNVVTLAFDLQNRLAREVPVAKIFQYPTVASFARYMEIQHPQPDDNTARQEGQESQIPVPWERVKKRLKKKRTVNIGRRLN